ncbi:MAG TPA: hypothetical protein VM029_11355 [Opitutaceae bacterium]|nr:hypothetical protein [Opitutaceae bacterium]
MNPPDPQDKLERVVHQALRELPTRRAPRTLESRVLAELERRAAQPWWRKSFRHWPVGARSTFALLSIGVVKVVLMLAVWMMAGFDTAQFHAAFATQFAWMQTIVSFGDTVAGSIQAITRSIPPLWLYGGLALFGAMYAALFGLGAAAYRTLYASR